MTSRFTEQEVEKYYDSEDGIYRAVWNEDGSVHWGVFDESTGDDFIKACANLDNIMVENGRIDHRARVLDLGCGNGTTAMSRGSTSAVFGCRTPWTPGPNWRRSPKTG